MKRLGILLLAACLVLAGCAAKSRPAAAASSPESGPGVKPASEVSKEGSYRQISQEQAMEMMAKDDGHIVVDVRRPDEYAAGHLPGAVCIPNENIGCDSPEALPDYDQIILIYCRSGNRSKQAAQKLAGMGYTQVYEFGGIMDWKGETVSGESGAAEQETTQVQTAALYLDSFDGGGPEYSVETADPELVAVNASRHYHKPDHDQMTGAGYTVLYEFRGLKPGRTSMVVSARSPIAENYDEDYSVTVDEALNVTLKALRRRMPGEEIVRPVLYIEAGERIFRVELEENSSVDALAGLLGDEELELPLREYGGFEKVGPLPFSLPRNDEDITTKPGDIILYQGNQLTIQYGQNSWSYTRLGRITDVTEKELREALGRGDVTVHIWLGEE